MRELIKKTLAHAEIARSPHKLLTRMQLASDNLAESQALNHEAIAFAKTLGMSQIMILHGMNFLTPSGKHVVVIGPTGIGKTTALRTLEKQGNATTIEDGKVCIGIRATHSLASISPGMTSVRKKITTIGSILRNITGYRTEHSKNARPWGKTRRATDLWTSRAERIAAIYSTPKNEETTEPQILPVDAILLFSHKLSPTHGMLYEDNGPRKLQTPDIHRLHTLYGIQVIAVDAKNHSVQEMIDIIRQQAETPK
ncbi:hypothetical protein HY995_01165 [Candidatus Micrarchaeota archaeon]|nr:hypothetical protein [Candidatus Micrarchaeota archaeon]